MSFDGRLVTRGPFGVAVGVMLALSSCGQSGDDREEAPGPGEVAQSREAKRVVGETRSRFLLAHHEMPDEHKSLWEEIQEELSRKDEPALRDSPVKAFARRADGRLAPVVRTEKARVSLAAWAHEATRIASVTSPVAIEVSLRGAKAQPAEVGDGYVVYRDGLGTGAHLIQRATEDGTEDHVHFPSRPAKEELVYTVDVTAVAGVRVVEGANAVEFLSDDGTPRLHMAPPHLVDSRGETLSAKVDVTGCSYDTDPHAPWGRPVTAPGSSTCEVRVSWEGLGAAYPVLVDPAWTQTGVPLVPRAWHQMVLLDDGTAMSLGGYLPAGATASMEIWNNGTWAAGASMNIGRSAFQARKLDNGDVIAIGGDLTTSRWDKATAKWIVDAGSAPKMNHGTYFGMAKLTNGKLLAVSISTGGGAASKDAETYDPVTKTWTVVANMNHSRGFLQNQVLGLPDGRAFVIGGSGPDGGVTELYDPVLNTWTDGPKLVQGGGRALGVALALADGRIFMSGVVTTVETLNLNAPVPAWSVSSPSPQSAVHAEHTAIQLINGRVLLHGSYLPTKPESQTWDPVYNTWQIEAGITKVSDFPASVRFADARVLVTGGSAVVDSPANNSPIAWLFGCTTNFDCGGDIPYCEVSSGKCRPCISDNGSGGAQACQDPNFPFCSPTGSCDQCKPTDLTHCSAGTSACDTTTHYCVTCNGNYGSGVTAPCPDASKPFCNAGTGLCDPTCTSDAQCAASQFCDDLTPTGTCKAKLANGSPTPTAMCDSVIGGRVCLTGACDPTDKVCGVDFGHGTCATTSQCNAGVCVTTGANTGRCETCDTDPDCGAGKVCDAVNACVQCAPGKTASCTGATPVCKATTETCVGCVSAADCPTPTMPLCDPATDACGGCTGDDGQPGLACPASSPVCFPTGACGKCASNADCATGTHAGGICNPSSGACGTQCTVDGDCPGKWCDDPSALPGAGTCAPLVASGQPLPATSPISGVCSATAAARACAAGVCDPASNLCGLANGDGPCTPANGSVTCISGVCDPADGKCGLANDDGPCTPANGATICRSGSCTASGVCEPAGGCAQDSDCAATEFCNTETSTCAGKLANGTPVPTVAGHSPPLDGSCSAVAAAVVCASSVCDGQDGSCGYLNGDGPCTSANATVVCRSGVCDASGICGYADGQGPCTDGTQCVSGICGPNGICGTPGTGGAGGTTTSSGTGGTGGTSATGGSATSGTTSPTGTGGAASAAPEQNGGCGCATVGRHDDARTLAGSLVVLALGALRASRRRRLGAR